MASNNLEFALRLIAETDGFTAPMDVAKKAATALTGALAAIGLGLSAKEVLDIADATQQMASRLKNATASTEEYNLVQARLLELANGTYRPLQEAQEIYLATSNSMKSLGYSTEEILSVTESLSYSFTHNAASSDKARSAQDAFAKSLDKGRVDADAWSSILAAADNIVGDLAKSTGKTESEIRSLGANGKLSITDLNTALMQSRDRNQELADVMSTSTKDAIQSVRNNVTALIGSLNEQYGITDKLAEVIKGFGENMDWLVTLFEDAIAAVGAWSSELGSIDDETVVALKQALSAAYDVVKDLISIAFEMGKTVFEVFTAASKSVSILTGDVDEAGNSVSFLTRIVQGLSIAFGFVSDGITAIKIGVNLLTGAFYDFGAGVAAVMSKITFGDVSKRYEEQAEYLKGVAKKNYAEAEQLAMDFESKGVQRLQQATKTKAELYAEDAANAKKRLDEISTSAEASEADKIKAVQKWAEAAIAANNGVLSGEMQREMIAKGFIITMDEAGKVAVQAFKQSVGAINENTEALKRTGEAAAKSLGIDVERAATGVSKSFNDAKGQVNDLAAGLKAMGFEGQQASNVIYASLKDLLAKAKTKEEVEIVRQSFVDFGKDGKLSADMVDMGLKAVSQTLQKLPADLDPVEQAFERLGIKTKEQLRLAAQSALADFATIAASGQGTAEDVRKAYERTMQAAIASGDAAVISQAKASASAAGLTVKIDETGKVTTKTYAEIVNGSDGATKATDRVSSGFGRIGNAAHGAARSTGEAAQAAVNSLDAWSKKLDEITRKQGGMTGNDFLNGGSSGNSSASGAQTFAYTSEEQIMKKLMDEAGYDAKRAKVKAHDLMNDTSWAKATDGAFNWSLSNYDYINKTVADLARVSNGTTGTPAKTVKYDIKIGNNSAELYGNTGSEDQVNALMAELERLKKGM